jgi:hypothetical protein
MVDLMEVVINFYYHPKTQGKNGLKYVLPTTLAQSKQLQEKWSKPTYNSVNFKNHAWVTFDSKGEVVDPYSTLPEVFKGVSVEQMDQFVFAKSGHRIAEGGAAMMAFAKMQFSHVSEEERGFIISALKKYCELDTLAMVMIYEYFREVTGGG